jgi:hypothetical protein
LSQEDVTNAGDLARTVLVALHNMTVAYTNNNTSATRPRSLQTNNQNVREYATIRQMAHLLALKSVWAQTLEAVMAIWEIPVSKGPDGYRFNYASPPNKDHEAVRYAVATGFAVLQAEMDILRPSPKNAQKAPPIRQGSGISRIVSFFSNTLH